MSLIITRTTGESYRLEDLGLVEKEWMTVSTPTQKTEVYEIEGMHGVYDGETYLRERSLKANFYALVDRVTEMEEKRREIFDLFDARERFYLSEERMPGLRWFVRCASPFSIKEAATVGDFEVDFVSASPFQESDYIAERRYKETQFIFDNEGNERITLRSPLMFETEIRFKGASNGLAIENKTNGKKWKYNGTTGVNDEILLKGITAMKNGQSIFGQTNYELLEFEKGYNEMEVSGAAGDFLFTIRSRFYFR